MPASAITWTLEADFNQDDAFSDDLTSDVQQHAGPINIKRGLNDEGVYQVAQVTLGLSNTTGRFTPENTSGPFYGNLRSGVPMRVKANHNSIDYTLFTAFAQRWRPQWTAGSAERTACLLYDLAWYIRNFTPMNVTSSISRTTDQALRQIATNMGLEASDLSLAVGQQTLALHWARSQDAMSAMMDVVRSEMGGFLYVNKSGVLTFEDRSSRLGVSSVDHTWGDDSAGADIFPARIDYDLSDDDLVARVTVEPNIFQVGSDATEIYREGRGKDTPGGADSRALTAGEIWEFRAHYTAPITALAPVTATTDYLGDTVQDGSGSDKTSALTVTVTDEGASANIKIENTDAGTVFLTFFRLRGTPIEPLTSRPKFLVTKSIPFSKADAGVHLSVPFTDDAGQKSRDYAVQILFTYRYPLVRLKLEFDLERNDATAASLLNAELGDLVAYKDVGLGADGSFSDDWYYLEALEYRIAVGRVTRAIVTLVPSQSYRNLDKIAYDFFNRADTSGDLGSTLNGKTWADDSGFDIEGNTATPNALTVQTPNIELSAADQDVEVHLRDVI